MGPTLPSGLPDAFHNGATTKRSTPRYPAPLTTRQPGLSSAKTVCVQYVSVLHDVDCGRRQKRHVPDTRHLEAVLLHHGGSSSSPFTAPTFQHARDHFRNLLPLDVDTTVSMLLFTLTCLRSPCG
jgi:hypothetical protein